VTPAAGLDGPAPAGGPVGPARRGLAICRCRGAVRARVGVFVTPLRFGADIVRAQRLLGQLAWGAGAPEHPRADAADRVPGTLRN
jgi:hypothetical protein